jgi:hypothetical protein
MLAYKIGIVTSPEARALPQPVTTIIAGAAPTPQVIGELEKKGIRPVHVYGLTQVCLPSSSVSFSDLILSLER